MSSSSPIEVARSYYRAWTTNDFERLSPLLADDLAIEVPINAYGSKAGFVEAVVLTAKMTTNVELLAALGSADEAMLLYDMTLPIGNLRVAEHFTVAGGQIRRIRQVHDTAALRAAGFAQSYNQVQPVAASRERVYDALTTLEGLRGWWTPLVSGSGATGGELKFGFEGLDEEIVMQVEAATRPTSVRWRCVGHSSLPEWADTTLVFDLVERAESTSEIHFQHLGLTQKLECYESCSAGWDYFLASIASFVASGHGSPYKEVNKGADGVRSTVET